MTLDIGEVSGRDDVQLFSFSATVIEFHIRKKEQDSQRELLANLFGSVVT